jgi:membrane-bound ClpP family serine protease
MADKGEISTRKAWLLILASLADDFVILAVVIGLLWYFKEHVPLWAMIAIGLAVGSFIFVRTWAVLPSIRKKKITGAEGMIGMVGEVVESPPPGMLIRVSGEYWQAACPDGDIEVGEEVEILKIKGLNLEVRRKES